MKTLKFTTSTILMSLVFGLKSQNICLTPPFPHTFTTQPNPTNMITGDLNNDGKDDVITLASNSGSIFVHLGNNLSIFNPPITYSTGLLNVKSSKLVDLNKDGALDLVSSYFSSGKFSISYGNGLGSFSTTTLITIPFFSNINEFNFGDFNNDTNIDIFFSDSSPVVYFGNGIGGFSVINQGFYSETGDFNNDGTIDFVVVAPSGIRLLYGNGSNYFFGTFTLIPIPVSYTYNNLIPVDINNDGNLDLIAQANTLSNNMDLLIGNGAGSFSLAFSFSFTTIYTPFISDLNNDNKKDFVIAKNGDYEVFMNNSGISFNYNYIGSFSKKTGSFNFSFFDINGDNTKEIIICDNAANSFYVSYTQPNGYGMFPLVISNKDYIGTSSLVGVEDVDNDNLNDIVSSDGGIFSVFKNKGNGFWPENNYLGWSIGSTRIVDLNNDGKKDLAYVTGQDSVSTMLNLGNGNFGSRLAFKVGNNAKSLACGDVNSDGKVDIVVTNANDNNIRVLTGNGLGGLLTTSIIPVPGGNLPKGIEMGDLNNDGKIDLVVGKFGGSLTSFLGNGLGGFTAVGNYGGVAVATDGIVLKDFNNDNKLDVAAANGTSLTVFMGTGLGTFTLNNVSVVNTLQYGLNSGDINQDGNIDIVSPVSNGFIVYQGLGNGNFLNSFYPVKLGIGSIIADVNNDFLPDIIGSGLAITINNGSFINSSLSQTLCVGNNIILNGPSSSSNFTWSPTGINTNSILINTPGNYYVTVSNPYNGCLANSNTISIISSTNTAPTITVVASQPFLCAGQTVTLNALGASSYTWNSGNTAPTLTLQPNSSSTISVNGLASNGCSSYTTYPLIVNTIPTINVITTASTICIGQTAALIATGATNYTINPGSILASSVAVNPSSTTIYTVQGASNGCISAKSFTLNVSSCTQLDGYKFINEIRCYPNPVVDDMIIEFDERINGSISISNSLGQAVVYNKFNNQSSISLNLSELASGLYTLEVNFNNLKKVFKIVK